MSLFPQSWHERNAPARRFELLHSVLCIATSVRLEERALTLGLFALLGRNHAKESLRYRSHRSITVTPEEIGREPMVDTVGVERRIGDLQRNMHRLPVQFGKDPGLEGAGSAFFDILSVHEAVDRENSLVWWVRPGMWMETQMSSYDRLYFFAVLSVVAEAATPDAMRAVCSIGLAMAHARDQNALFGLEEIAVDRLLGVATEVIDKNLLVSDGTDGVMGGDDLICALDLLLIGDVVECYRTDKDGRLWLTAGACLS